MGTGQELRSLCGVNMFQAEDTESAEPGSETTVEELWEVWGRGQGCKNEECGG